MVDKIQVLREIDKLDKIGVDGVRAMLTTGRVDASGAFVPGCGLMDWQANILCDAVSCTAATNEETLSNLKRIIRRAADISVRIDVIVLLEEIDIGGGRTAWEAFLDKLDPEKHSLFDEVDKLVDAFRALSKGGAS